MEPTESNDYDKTEQFLYWPVRFARERNRGLWTWFETVKRQIGWNLKRPVMEWTLLVGPIHVIFGSVNRRVKTIVEDNRESEMIMCHYSQQHTVATRQFNALLTERDSIIAKQADHLKAWQIQANKLEGMISRQNAEIARLERVIATERAMNEKQGIELDACTTALRQSGQDPESVLARH